MIDKTHNLIMAVRPEHHILQQQRRLVIRRLVLVLSLISSVGDTGILFLTSWCASKQSRAGSGTAGVQTIGKFDAELCHAAVWRTKKTTHKIHMYYRMIQMSLYVSWGPGSQMQFIASNLVLFTSLRMQSVIVVMAHPIFCMSQSTERSKWVTSLVARGRCAHLHDTRAWRTSNRSHANLARNICVTYAADSRHIRCKCCVHLPREERVTRDVTFGPLRSTSN
jgi:hypothetical protein